MQSDLEKQRIENYYRTQKIIKNINSTSKNGKVLFDYVDCLKFLKEAIPYRDSKELYYKYQEEIITFIEELGIDDNEYSLEEFKDALDCVEDERLIDIAKQCYNNKLQALCQYAIQLDSKLDIENASNDDIDKIYCLFENLSSFKDVNKYVKKYKELQDKRNQQELEYQYQNAALILNYEDKNTKKILAQKKYYLLEAKARQQLEILNKLPKNYKKTKEYIDEAEFIVASSKYSKELNKKKKTRKAILTLLLFIVAAIATIIGVVQFTKNNRYQNAVRLYEEMNYREAKKALLECKGYKDSKELYDKIKYFDLQKGDIIHIGRTEDTSNFWETGFRKKYRTDIEWLVLDVVEDEALLISVDVLGFYRYALGNELYFKDDEELRFKSWFNENEQNHFLLTSTLEKDGETSNEVNFFALTLEQYTQYANDEALGEKVKNSKLLPHNSAFLKAYDKEDYTGMNLYRDIWYLATYSEEDKHKIACVKIADGKVGYESTNQYRGFYVGIRPAVYVKIDN